VLTEKKLRDDAENNTDVASAGSNKAYVKESCADRSSYSSEMLDIPVGTVHQ